MPSTQKLSNENNTLSAFGYFASAAEYMIDAAQRSILFWDVMRQRGNQYREHLAEVAPHVLSYRVELVADGRSLKRPVNYLLARVVPPLDIEIDPKRRPFVVVDPRAGHGPGIGGFKADSEIGVALGAGHPCYFVGFLPEPMPGQTIEDIAHAEAIFLEKVAALHPDAEGKPCVIGNCQAGWAVMMLAAVRPDLFGPIIVAGSPLSYWAGVRGKNPMRYTGGLLGGSWLAALISDLGCGKFDGAWLVQNFENLNPANTLWSKQYNLYSKIDTETPRYLEFERWWGGHVNLNDAEIQFIVDELFIGNNLAAGRIQTSDGTTVDLRNIRSPIVVFCSKGDDITPPQQALGWILDLYETVDEIRSYGQTIVYTIHETAGHLGIFVSGGIARKEHGKFSSNIDLIDTLPPGLYEAVFEAKAPDLVNPELATGDWVMRCETRTLDDIRALGGDDDADRRCFATVDKVSQVNLALYRTFLQPIVRAASTPIWANLIRQLHPLRASYEFLTDTNPLMPPIGMLADRIRRNRRPASANNPFIAIEENASRQIVAGLDTWRDMAASSAERTFLAVYGSQPLQTASGVDRDTTKRARFAPKSLLHRDLVQRRLGELLSRLSIGGLREAVIRGLLFAGMARNSVDERGFEMLRAIRKAHDDIPLSAFKAIVREQFMLLLLDSEGALAAIPAMLPGESEKRLGGFNLIRQVIGARGKLSTEDIARMARLERLFGIESMSSDFADLSIVPAAGSTAMAS